MASAETACTRLAAFYGLHDNNRKLALDEDMKAQSKILTEWVEGVNGIMKADGVPQHVPQHHHTVQESEETIAQDDAIYLSQEEGNLSRSSISMSLAEPDFTRLAASKGLNETTIKALLDEDIDSLLVLSALNLDDINALGLFLTKAQTKILTAWVEEIKGGESTNFHQLASSKKLKEPTIKALFDEDFDTVQSMSMLTLDDINKLRLTKGQTKLLIAWVEEIKRMKTDSAPEDLLQFHQKTEQESKPTIAQEEANCYLSREEENLPTVSTTEGLPTPLNITECIEKLEIPEKNKKASKEYIKNRGIAGLDLFLQSQLDCYKNCPVNIAITGASGMGKSSLINSMRGVLPDAEDAAPTGPTETTMEPTPYAHPDMKDLVFWDLPGIGTESFKSQQYVELLNIENNYDALIICNSGRFTENDVMLANVCKEANIPFYIVRTKIDQDLENERRAKRHSFNQETVLKKIRCEVEEKLKDQKLPTDMIFLVSTWDPMGYDSPKLIDELIKNAPEKNKNGMILSLTNLSQNGIAQKSTELKKRIPEVIPLLISQNTKQKMRVIVDTELCLIAQQFSLTDDCVDKLGIRKAALNSLFDGIRMGIYPEGRGYSKIGLGLFFVTLVFYSLWIFNDTRDTHAHPEAQSYMYTKIAFGISMVTLGIYSLIDISLHDSEDELRTKFTKFFEDTTDRCANAAVKTIHVAMKK